MKILITGGPVHAKLDAVKFVTNRFKGGLMAKLADEFARGNDALGWGVETVYLTSKGAKLPEMLQVGADRIAGQHDGERIVYHDGFHDYREKVIAMAPEFDAVILGAAVANLIPVCYMSKGVQVSMFDYEHEEIPLPLEGKFPSHDYKPGDTFMMKWQIAPRIIDEVKAVMKKEAHLFGFKLLGGVSHEELVSASYGVLLESKATVVFANDVSDLNAVTAITKERGEHPMSREGIAPMILDCLADEYYRTESEVILGDDDQDWVSDEETKFFKGVLDKADLGRFLKTPEGYMFGTVAVRNPFQPMGKAHDRGFLTTARGKNELDGVIEVVEVDHERRVVVKTGDGKPTLNAPLLDYLFQSHPKVDRIEHYHDQVASLPTLPYAPPGTVRDSKRDVDGSFNIDGHGCFLLHDEEGNQL